MVAAGLNHTCAMSRSHIVKCWGDNALGQLGNGSTIDSPVPVTVRNLVGEVVDLSVGDNHACVSAYIPGAGYKNYCWGDNSFGQLGAGPAQARVAVEVPGLETDSDSVVDLDAGGNHTCALMNSGRVLCWGDNSAGQLGDGTTVSSPSPVEVKGLNRPGIPIVAAAEHTCVLIADAGVKCWGNNDHGQLGNGTTESSSLAVDVVGSERMVFLAAGRYHTCGLMDDGEVTCWGQNLNNQLGDGTGVDRSQPVGVGGLRNARFIASGAAGQHTCVLLESGQVNCWGWNGSGQLGDGTRANRSVPVEVNGLNADASVIAAGRAHTCAVLIYGGIKCWGANDHGQLGDNTYEQRLLPVDVIGAGGFPLTATSPGPFSASPAPTRAQPARHGWRDPMAPGQSK